MYIYISFSSIIYIFTKLMLFNISDPWAISKRINISSENTKLIIHISLKLQYMFSISLLYMNPISKRDIYIHDQTSAGTPFLPSAIFTASKHDRNLSLNSLLHSVRAFHSSFHLSRHSSRSYFHLTSRDNLVRAYTCKV